MRVGLVVDRLTVTRWQAEAIQRLGETVEFVVYNCTDAPPAERRLRHYPYYLLNLISLRGPLTRRAEIAGLVNIAGQVDFQCEIDGPWQKLPPTLIDRMNADGCDAIVKFGLGLLRVPEQLNAPILSYHHGDPRRYRGRPAGFYELLEGERVLGQIVQILSDRVDAGAVVAFAETPVHSHNYRSTMREAYAASPSLLGRALDRAVKRQSLELTPAGKVYRLPSTWTVLRFAGQRLAAKLRRLAYGALVEKRWEVAEAPMAFDEGRLLQSFPPSPDWKIVKRPPGYSFLADPFPHPSGTGLLVEALRSSTGLGEIVRIDADGSRPMLRGDGHYSYPATLITGDGHFMVPEICEWSRPRLFRLDRDSAHPLGHLAMSPPARLVDPTLFEREGTVFLFANDYAQGDFNLRLWCAEALHGPFEEHPASPILISPRGGRMGGLLIQRNGLYRVGQDGSSGYGNGILLFRVDELTRTSYRETLVDRLQFSNVRGPHTLNITGNNVLFDFYTHRFAPMAGLRRLRNRIASRGNQSASSR